MKTKNYLNDVMSLTYSKKSEVMLKKGELAILYEDYHCGKIDITRYEVRKKIIEDQIKELSRNVK